MKVFLTFFFFVPIKKTDPEPFDATKTSKINLNPDHVCQISDVTRSGLLGGEAAKLALRQVGQSRAGKSSNFIYFRCKNLGSRIKKSQTGRLKTSRLV